MRHEQSIVQDMYDPMLTKALTNEFLKKCGDFLKITGVYFDGEFYSFGDYVKDPMDYNQRVEYFKIVLTAIAEVYKDPKALKYYMSNIHFATDGSINDINHIRNKDPERAQVDSIFERNFKDKLLVEVKEFVNDCLSHDLAYYEARGDFAAIDPIEASNALIIGNTVIDVPIINPFTIFPVMPTPAPNINHNIWSIFPKWAKENDDSKDVSLKEVINTLEQDFEAKRETVSNAFEKEHSVIREDNSTFKENTPQDNDASLKIEDIIQTSSLLRDLLSDALNDKPIETKIESNNNVEESSQEHVSMEKTQLLPLEFSQLEVLH